MPVYFLVDINNLWLSLKCYIWHLVYMIRENADVNLIHVRVHLIQFVVFMYADEVGHV